VDAALPLLSHPGPRLPLTGADQPVEKVQYNVIVTIGGKNMAQQDTRQPSRIYRGTVDEVFSHRNEIPPGATVELKVFEETPKEETATMALVRSWLAEDATDDPEEICAAEEELREFKRNMNLPRKEAGARLLYPEVE
jgi:hypothetical protein